MNFESYKKQPETKTTTIEVFFSSQDVRNISKCRDVLNELDGSVGNNSGHTAVVYRFDGTLYETSQLFATSLDYSYAEIRVSLHTLQVWIYKDNDIIKIKIQ